MTYFEKPSTPDEALIHFGIRGMKWGKHTAKTPMGKSSPRPKSKPQFSGQHAPQRPREASVNSSRGDQLVSRAVNQGYDRVVGPAMARHVVNIPNYKTSPDPKVNELLSRVLTQSLNRVEEQAGRQYVQNLPRGAY